MKKILLSAVMAATVMMAQDGFDLTPTPVSQTQIDSDATEGMTRLTGLYATIDDAELSGAGVQVAKKTGKEGGATNLSGALMMLSGSGGGMDSTVVSGNVAYLWENYQSPQEAAGLTIFYGADFSYVYMNMYSDALEIDVYTMMYGGTAGLQYNHHTPSLIISPFAVGKYLMGSYEADIWGNSYSSESDSIDPIFNTAFGFDVFFKSTGTTLSAMLKSDSGSTTTMVSYAWFW